MTDTVFVNQQETNGLGTAGFVCALIGWLTCGLLCPIGLIMSLVALLFRPRGFAIAGVVVGSLGIGFLWLVGFGFITMFAAMIGIGSAAIDEATKASEEFQAEYQAALDEAEVSYDDEVLDTQLEAESETLEPVGDYAHLQAVEPESQPVPDPEPESQEPEWHTFADSTGKFSVEAQLVGVMNGEVTLRKRDGSEAKLPMARLSAEDQTWIRKQAAKRRSGH